MYKYIYLFTYIFCIYAAPLCFRFSFLFFFTSVLSNNNNNNDNNKF